MAKRIIATLIFAVFCSLGLKSQLSTITFLHNSPDPELAAVDVYITQTGNTSKVEDFAYKSGTIFPDAIIFGGFPVQISIGPANSTSEEEATLVRATFTPEPDEGYQVELIGVMGDEGWAENPDGVSLQARIKQQLVPLVEPVFGEVAVMFSQGVTDLEECDVYVRGSSTPLFAGLKFGDITPTPKNIKRQRHTIDLTKAGDKSRVLASFEVDLTLTSSDVIILTSSGFKTPQDNKGSSIAMRLLGFLDDGSVLEYELLTGSQTARVQFIHDSPDPTATVVDIYVNGERKLDNLNFRKASSFADYEAGTPVILAVAPATSTSPNDAFFRDTLAAFRPGRSYHILLHGVRDTSKFAKNPGGSDISLNFTVAEGALETSPESGKTAVRMMHGVTDLGRCNVASSQATYATSLPYSGVTPEYIIAEPIAMDTMWVYNSETGSKIRGWIADLRGTNRAVAALISGFIRPDSNQNGQDWKLILVDANGAVNDRLVAVDTGTPGSVDDIVPGALWSVAPNPAANTVNVVVPVTSEQADRIGAQPMLRLVSLTGQVVVETNCNLDGERLNASLSVSGFPSGTYMIQVIGSGNRVVGAAPLRVNR